jgi:hypothetical protein
MDSVTVSLFLRAPISSIVAHRTRTLNVRRRFVGRQRKETENDGESLLFSEWQSAHAKA